MLTGLSIWSLKELKSKMPGIPDRQVFMCIVISVYACSKWMYEGIFFLLWFRCCSVFKVGFPKLCSSTWAHLNFEQWNPVHTRVL